MTYWPYNVPSSNGIGSSPIAIGSSIGGVSIGAGGGKSWAVAAMGAYATSLGFNVVHYSLELGEGYVGKRYDAIFSGIDVDKLKDHRKEVDELPYHQYPQCN